MLWPDSVRSGGVRYGDKAANPMILYKGYPIYGIAVSTLERCWSSRGLVFDRDQNQTIEIKRIECPAELTFKRKQLAEDTPRP